MDIGQVEGAFMMGVGFWLSEKMNYDKTAGLLLTDGTWEYKPPASQVKKNKCWIKLNMATFSKFVLNFR